MPALVLTAGLRPTPAPRPGRPPRSRLANVVATALVCFWPGVALAAPTTAAFSAAADARVEQAHPDANFATGILETDGDAGAAIDSYLRFVVTGVSAPVQSARLRLFVMNGGVAGPAVYQAAADWSETAITWNQAPATFGAALDSVGKVKNNRWVELDVTAAVQGNGAVGFRLTQTSGDDTTIRSREQSKDPQLLVTFDPAQGACVGQPNGTPCSDDTVCTQDDACVGGLCQPGALVDCNDGNACTTDSCHATLGCQHANNSQPCDLDGDACTLDACGTGSCKPGPDKNCSDGNTCTVDACAPATGDCSHALDPGNPSCTAPSPVLIAINATWRYFATGTAAPSTWRTIGFDDGGWPAGAAELGYGDGDEATVIPYGGSASNKYITTYFRRTFQVADASAYPPLVLRLVRDDGAVVYLNGNEVLRRNLPSGTIGYATLASSAIDDQATDEIELPASWLVDGTNVVAVEVHQANASSSDVSFALELRTETVATEPVETQCDGVDNDNDGVTDLLLPVADNACTTSGVGACGQGFAACIGGARVCLTPPPVAEAVNGRDDDCNGTVDDVPNLAARPVRVRVMLPPNLGLAVANGVVEALQAIGAPYKAVATSGQISADWAAAFGELSSFSVAVIAGSVSSLTTTQQTQLQDFVNGGGVLVLIKPNGGAPLTLAGATAATQRLNLTHVLVDPSVPAALYLDSAEERTVKVSDDSTSPVLAYSYSLNTGTGVVGFGTGKSGNSTLGPVWLRRPLGQGAVYTFGFDALDYTDFICYINCFDPGRDVMAMLLRGVLREAGRGHDVRKHTVPGLESTVVLLTHDIDAPDSHNDGEWGEAGAAAMAKMQVDLGVRGTYMITTDYVAGYYNPNIITELCSLGMCPAGGHSIQHLDMRNLQVGDCSVTQATYNPNKPTLCGEIVVNVQLIKQREAPGTPVLSWRTPYLAVHTSTYDVLAAQGFLYDSSFAIGDLRTNFPAMVARFPSMQWVFHGQPMVSFPIVQEDGLGFVNPDGSFGRVELQARNQKQFLTLWTYALLQNLANGAWNMHLVHPSYGVGEGVGPENTAVKVDSVKKFTQIAQGHSVRFGTMDDMGAFWRARDAVQLSGSYASGTGYSGTIQVGALSAPGFSLEFGDRIGTFSCPGAGPVTVSGQRVVFQSALPAGAAFAYTATVP